MTQQVLLWQPTATLPPPQLLLSKPQQSLALLADSLALLLALAAGSEPAQELLLQQGAVALPCQLLQDRTCPKAARLEWAAAVLAAPCAALAVSLALGPTCGAALRAAACTATVHLSQWDSAAGAHTSCCPIFCSRGLQVRRAAAAPVAAVLGVCSLLAGVQRAAGMQRSSFGLSTHPTGALWLQGGEPRWKRPRWRGRSWGSRRRRSCSSHCRRAQATIWRSRKSCSTGPCSWWRWWMRGPDEWGLRHASQGVHQSAGDGQAVPGR